MLCALTYAVTLGYGVRVTKKHGPISQLFLAISGSVIYVGPVVYDHVTGALTYRYFDVTLLLHTVGILSLAAGFLFAGWLHSGLSRPKVFRRESEMSAQCIENAAKTRGDQLATRLAWVLALTSFISTNYSVFSNVSSIVDFFASYLSDYNDDPLEKLRLYSIPIFSSSAIYIVSKAGKYSNFLITPLIIELALIHLLRGYRIPALVIAAPFLFFILSRRGSVPLKYLLFCACVVYFGQVVDIFRAVGLLNISDVNFRQPLSVGEFGQMFRSFEMHLEQPYLESFSSYSLGASIVFGPFLNMMTTFGIDYLPISSVFAVLHSGGKITGFGFSPLLESWINFKYFFFIYFFILGGIIFLFDRKIVNKSANPSVYFLSFGLWIIFWRIDISVFIKMNILLFIVISFLDFISRSRWDRKKRCPV